MAEFAAFLLSCVEIVDSKTLAGTLADSSSHLIEPISTWANSYSCQFELGQFGFSILIDTQREFGVGNATPPDGQKEGGVGRRAGERSLGSRVEGPQKGGRPKNVVHLFHSFPISRTFGVLVHVVRALVARSPRFQHDAPGFAQTCKVELSGLQRLTKIQREAPPREGEARANCWAEMGK